MSTDLQTISWDNSNIYSSFQDPNIEQDLKFIQSATDSIKDKTPLFASAIPLLDKVSPDQLNETIPLARELMRMHLDVQHMLINLNHYASTALSVNSQNSEAKNLSGLASQLVSKSNMAMKPLNLFLMKVPETYLDLFLSDDSVEEMSFLLRNARERNDFFLSPQEEVLQEALTLDGYEAWYKLYIELASSLKVTVGSKELPISAASNLLYQDNRSIREEVYRGIQKVWKENEITAGAVLNSVNGWRLANYKIRSEKKELHYLDEACFKNRISQSTLEAMTNTVYENRHIGQNAFKLMAQEMGVSQIGPWDTLAPLPSIVVKKPIPFPEAMEIVTEAFAQLNPEMSAFAQIMYKKRWIDCSPSQNRGQGAYCTGFVKGREPRVFMTYDGSMKNVITLAHELGHAYHNWVMRDMKLEYCYYPSTLAETASIFAETLVRDSLLERAKTPEEKKSILWQELTSAGSFLIDIPTRFEFDKNLAELRKLKPATVPELKNIMKQAWTRWYEDSVSEANELFWASKMHFAMTRAFYNFPYLFGYLFSLGVYAKKGQLGSDFSRVYIQLLRDTGTMTAEDLIQKHFNENITQSAFWQKSLSIVDKTVNLYRGL